MLWCRCCLTLYQVSLCSIFPSPTLPPGTLSYRIWQDPPILCSPLSFWGFGRSTCWYRIPAWPLIFRARRSSHSWTLLSWSAATPHSSAYRYASCTSPHLLPKRWASSWSFSTNPYTCSPHWDVCQSISDCRPFLYRAPSGALAIFISSRKVC